MFKGIITGIGVINGIITTKNSDQRVFIKSDSYFANSQVGDSIACSGVCLTIVEIVDCSLIVVEVSPATRLVSNLQNWLVGDKINLELAMRLSDRIDGHLVQGHVDGVAEIQRILAVEGSHEIQLLLQDHNLSKLIAVKGSISVDGISLTVNQISDENFVVNVISYTWHHTTLQYRNVGDMVNIEVDLIARYVGRLLSK